MRDIQAGGEGRRCGDSMVSCRQSVDNCAFVPLFVQSLAEHKQKTGLNSEKGVEIGGGTINNLRETDDPILLAGSSSDLK